MKKCFLLISAIFIFTACTQKKEEPAENSLQMQIEKTIEAANKAIALANEASESFQKSDSLAHSAKELNQEVSKATIETE